MAEVKEGLPITPAVVQWARAWRFAMRVLPTAAPAPGRLTDEKINMTTWVFRLARWSAIVGGVVLCAITLMSVTSITGRALSGVGLGPVPGDFELVEVGTVEEVLLDPKHDYTKSLLAALPGGTARETPIAAHSHRRGV